MSLTGVVGVKFDRADRVALGPGDAPNEPIQNWVIAGVCFWLFRVALCFSDLPYDSNAFIPKEANFSVFLQSAAGFKWVIFDRLQPNTKCTVLEPDLVELALTHIRSNVKINNFKAPRYPTTYRNTLPWRAPINPDRAEVCSVFIVSMWVLFCCRVEWSPKHVKKHWCLKLYKSHI